MEGEKYNLAKAQEEAEKLPEKVESSDVSSNGAKEKFVKQKIFRAKEELMSLSGNGRKSPAF